MAIQQNHILKSYSIDGANRNAVLLTNQPPNGKLIVFVHGFQFFKNSPTLPWKHFQYYIAQEPAFDQCDVLFFGYNCESQIYATTHVFCETLRDLIKRPKRYMKKAKLNKLFERQNGFNYSNIILVSHSMGSVIVRSALNYLYNDGEVDVVKCKHLLFAPAQSGELASKYIDLILAELGLSMLSYLAKIKWKAIDDLSPLSKTIVGLKQETKKLLAQDVKSFTIATKTILPTDDKVVIQEQYCDDRRPPIMLPKKHTNVNKPNANFYEPVEELITMI